MNKEQFEEYLKDTEYYKPKTIIKHKMVGFGVHARDIFICEEFLKKSDVIYTAYVIIDERDRCFPFITDNEDLTNPDIKHLFDIGCDYVGESLYYVVPGSETYCIKDKKVAGVCDVRSYLTTFAIYDEIPGGVNIDNWTDFIDKDRIIANLEEVVTKSAEYLNKINE